MVGGRSFSSKSAGGGEEDLRRWRKVTVAALSDCRELLTHGGLCWNFG